MVQLEDLPANAHAQVVELVYLPAGRRASPINNNIICVLRLRFKQSKKKIYLCWFN